MAGAPNVALLPGNPNTNQRTLVLDFQDTLVQASWEPLPLYDFTCTLDNRHTLYVLKRPGVDLFLIAMAEHFEIVIFTCTIKAYADAILEKLDTSSVIRHRLYRGSCKKFKGATVKDLSVLGRDLRNVIVVDSNPEHYMLQPENAMHISRFEGNIHDHALFDLRSTVLKAERGNGGARGSRRMVKNTQGKGTVGSIRDEEPSMAPGREERAAESKQGGEGFMHSVCLEFVALLAMTLAFGMLRR